MERTAQLNEFFELATNHSKQSNDDDKGAGSSPEVAEADHASEERVRQEMMAHPLYEAMRMLHASVEHAISTTAARIESTLAALDTCPAATSRLESALLLSEAELLSASTSVKEFSETVQTTLTKLEEEKELEQITGNRWGRRKQGSKGTATSTASKGEKSPQTGLSTECLTHYQLALTMLDVSVVRWRLKVMLCKEEVVLYKNEMRLFRHDGVLTCEDPMQGLKRCPDGTLVPATATASAGVGSPITSSGAAGGKLSSEERAAASPSAPALSSGASGWRGGHKGGMGFGLVTGVSMQTLHLVDDVVKRATDTVKEAGARADSALTFALTGHTTGGLLPRGSGSGSGGGGGSGGVFSLSALASSGLPFSGGRKTSGPGVVAGGDKFVIPQFTYTSEEERQLGEQNAALQLAQRTSTAQDAKAVEAAVRELSQLTSLMTTKLTEQSEQFSSVLKNTEEANTLMEKATKEVAKPVNAFWNPTRQLIAVLWVCTMIMLLANWVAP